LTAVVSAGTTGGPHARAQMIRTLTWQGAHVVAQLGITSPRTKSDASGRIVDTTTVDTIQQVAQCLVASIHLAGPDRLALVAEVTSAAGIEPGHLAPVPDP